MQPMDFFNIVAGTASIISLIISIISLCMVKEIQKAIKSRQKISDTSIDNGSVIQVGGDYKGK